MARLSAWLRGRWPVRFSAGAAIPLILALFAIWQQELGNADPNRFIIHGAVLLLAVVLALWLGSSAKTWRWKIRSPIYRPKTKTPQELQAEHEREESTFRAHQELSALHRGYAKVAFEALRDYIDVRRRELEEREEPLRSIGLLSDFMLRNAEREHKEVERNLEGWTELAESDSTIEAKERIIRLSIHRFKSSDLQWNFGIFYGAYETMAIWAPRLARLLSLDPERDPTFQHWHRLDGQFERDCASNQHA